VDSIRFQIHEYQSQNFSSARQPFGDAMTVAEQSRQLANSEIFEPKGRAASTSRRQVQHPPARELASLRPPSQTNRPAILFGALLIALLTSFFQIACNAKRLHFVNVGRLLFFPCDNVVSMPTLGQLNSTHRTLSIGAAQQRRSQLLAS
jgi:hypothetical protein